jgi:predicted nucleic acid-binding protein
MAAKTMRRNPDLQRRNRAFFDTNILLYADDSRFPKKQEKAVQLISEHRLNRAGVVSIQVLQEYYVNATGKLHLDPALARYKVDFYSRFELTETSASDVLIAIDYHRLNRVSYWDSMILHSAKKAGCGVLFTEDLQDGQIVDGVRIVNPFVDK